MGGDELGSNATACPEAGGHGSILWGGGVESVWLTSALFSCLVLFTMVRTHTRAVCSRGHHFLL